jgi:hypothetical protein
MTILTSRSRRNSARIASLLLAVALSVATAPDAAAARFQVYSLAIGSSTYSAPTSPGQNGLEDIYGANNGAKALAQRLRNAGAEFGFTLTSDEGQLITLPDIGGALKRVEATLAAARPSNPLLIGYFAGHGISEGVAWNHFSLPGTFTYEGKPEQLNIEDLSKTTLYARESGGGGLLSRP